MNNTNLAAHVAAFDELIAAQCLTQQGQSQIFIEPCDQVGEASKALPDAIVYALELGCEGSEETLAAATKIILDKSCGYQVTLDQVTTLLRHLADKSELQAAYLWNLRLIIERDGAIWTGLGGVTMRRQLGAWFVNDQHPHQDLAQAIRAAVQIALHHQ